MQDKAWIGFPIDAGVVVGRDGQRAFADGHCAVHVTDAVVLGRCVFHRDGVCSRITLLGGVGRNGGLRCQYVRVFSVHKTSALIGQCRIVFVVEPALVLGRYFQVCLADSQHSLRGGHGVVLRLTANDGDGIFAHLGILRSICFHSRSCHPYRGTLVVLESRITDGEHRVGRSICSIDIVWTCRK